MDIVMKFFFHWISAAFIIIVFAIYKLENFKFLTLFIWIANIWHHYSNDSNGKNTIKYLFILNQCSLLYLYLVCNDNLNNTGLDMQYN